MVSRPYGKNPEADQRKPPPCGCGDGAAGCAGSLSSRNPELNELIASKPHIVLLNKCDMADEAATRRWKAWFGRQGSPALAVDCRSGRGLNDYGDTVRELLRDKIQSNLEKGMAGRALRMMVVGIPNTGKSSFINRMAGRSRAKVRSAGCDQAEPMVCHRRRNRAARYAGVLWPKLTIRRWATAWPLSARSKMR